MSGAGDKDDRDPTVDDLLQGDPENDPVIEQLNKRIEEKYHIKISENVFRKLMFGFFFILLVVLIVTSVSVFIGEVNPGDEAPDVSTDVDVDRFLIPNSEDATVTGVERVGNQLYVTVTGDETDETVTVVMDDVEIPAGSADGVDVDRYSGVSDSEETRECLVGISDEAVEVVEVGDEVIIGDFEDDDPWSEDRIAGRVFVEQGDDIVPVGFQLISEGLGTMTERAVDYPEQYDDEERVARGNGVGLWSC